MTNHLTLFFFLVFSCLNYEILAESFTISGIISDSKSGETLIGANVFLSNDINTTSDVYGFYSLTLEVLTSISNLSAISLCL